MKTGRAIAISLAVAAVIGAGAFLIREQRVRECREAASYAATPNAFGGDAGAAVALAGSLHREKAEQCYREGYLETPFG
jgi:hypothetical protein